MSGLLKFNRHYFIIAIIIFLVEILIAFFIDDTIIRPYIGDFLVVILIYCFVKSFLNTPVWSTALAILLFSYAVEISQYFHFINNMIIILIRWEILIEISSMTSNCNFLNLYFQINTLNKIYNLSK